MNVRSIYELVKAAVSAWSADFAQSMGAALSYYTLFSVAPLLVIVIALAAVLFGQDAAQAAILEQARALLGPEGARAIESMLASAQSKPQHGLIASAASVVALLIGATSVFSELETDLNRIWGVANKRKPGLWSFLRGRVLSFGVILALGFLVMVSLVMSAALAAWGKYWSSWFGDFHLLLEGANLALSFVVTAVLFALIYKLMPMVHVRWRDVWIGSAVTAALFMVGKSLIGLYIGKSAIASAYGAGGALVALLVWVYYSAQIFLLGAEFTHIYAERHDPRANARTKPAKPSTRQALTPGAPHV
jgi:membrane protein